MNTANPEELAPEQNAETLAAPPISEELSEELCDQASAEPISESRDEKYAQKTASFSGDESNAANDANAETQMRRMSRRSFLWSAVAISGTFGGWKWLSTRREEDALAWPFRRVLQVNENIARDLFSPNRLAPTFARSKINPIRTNGDVGLGKFDLNDWQLNVEGLASGETLQLAMKDIKSLPRVEMITELKCIEGWSVINHWAGARFSDFAGKVGPATRDGAAPNIRNPENLLEYVGLETPDGAYYVGLDMATALHPQTLLCYEMNGKPLLPENGAPLRLVTPLKYGIKNLKRIGTIRFANSRPADYWAERGYDWYAGH